MDREETVNLLMIVPNEQNKYTTDMLFDAAAAELKEIGNVNVFDVSLQGLSCANPEAHSGLQVFYIKDLPDEQNGYIKHKQETFTERYKAEAEITILKESQDCLIRRIRLSPGYSQDDYCTLLDAVAKDIRVTDLRLTALYFDNPTDNNRIDSPSILLVYTN